jgi:hypothetical protein
VHQLVGAWLDSLLLVGILLAALVSIFKAGRWFQGMMSSIATLTHELETMRVALYAHIADEEGRFDTIDGVLRDNRAKAEEIRSEVGQLMVICKTNDAGKGGRR